MSYTPPAGNEVNFALELFTPSAYNEVDFDFSSNKIPSYLFGMEDFETGDKGQFDSENIWGGGSISYDGTGKITDDYTLKIDKSAEGGASLLKTLTGNWDNVFVQFKVHFPTSWSFGTSSYFGFLNFQNSSSSDLLSLSLENWGSGRITSWGAETSSYRDTEIGVSINNNTHKIEVQLIKDGTNGRLKVWIDNNNYLTPDYDSGNTNTGTGLINKILLGSVYSDGSHNSLYFDDVVIADTFIGEPTERPPLIFEWKGYNWIRSQVSPGGQYNNKISTYNIIGPDENDYLTARISNPTENSPIGAEIYSEKEGWGYGIYTTVVEFKNNPQDYHKNLVFGGLFTYDSNVAVTHNEIDMHELSAWGGGESGTDDVVLSHTYYKNVGGEPTPVVNYDSVSDNLIQTNVMIWEEGSLKFYTYAGVGTGGDLLLYSEWTEGVPTPADERLMLNIWAFQGDYGNASTIPETEIIIRDFSFFNSIDKTFTTDSIIKKTQIKTFNSDALIEKTNDKTFTTNTILKATNTKNITLDALLEKIEDKTFTANSLIQKTYEKEFSSNALIQETNEKEFTIDSLIKNIYEKEFSIGSILKSTYVKEFSLDTIVINTFYKSLSVDALIKKIQNKEFSIDTSIENTIEKEFSLDALIEKTNDKTFTIDGNIIKSNNKEFTTDSILKGTIEKTITANAIINTHFTKNFSVDALLQIIDIKEFNSDAIITEPNDKEITIDAVLKITNTKTFNSDALIKNAYIKTLSSDSLLQNAYEKEFTIDSALKSTINKELTSDAILINSFEKDLLVDALIKTTFNKEFTTESRLIRLIDKEFNSDAIITEPNDKEITIDAILLGISEFDNSILRELGETVIRIPVEMTTDFHGNRRYNDKAEVEMLAIFMNSYGAFNLDKPGLTEGIDKTMFVGGYQEINKYDKVIYDESTYRVESVGERFTQDRILFKPVYLYFIE